MTDAPALPSYRPARDEDATDLIALVGTCFALYPGCVLDVDGEEPILRRFAGTIRAAGGATRVAVDGTDRVIGMIAWEPKDADTVELRKLYVHPDAQRRGIGRTLTDWVLGEAAVFGASRVILWSDTRFSDAHRLYERAGFRRGPDTRALNDLSHTVEYFFDRPIAPSTPPTGTRDRAP